MSDESPRFVSDRRNPTSSSWKDGDDWDVGEAFNLGVVNEALVPQRVGIAADIPADGILDDFSSSSLSSGYIGDLDGWSVSDERAYVGGYSGQYDVGTSGPEQSIWNNNWTLVQGHTVEARLWSDEANSGSGFVIGTQEGSSLTGYVLGHETAGSQNSIQLLRLDPDGSRKTLDSSSATPPAREWLRAELDWRVGGELIYTLEDADGDVVDQLTAIDDTYPAGGFGWRGRAGVHSPAQLRVDYARVI